MDRELLRELDANGGNRYDRVIFKLIMERTHCRDILQLTFIGFNESKLRHSEKNDNGGK